MEKLRSALTRGLRGVSRRNVEERARLNAEGGSDALNAAHARALWALAILDAGEVARIFPGPVGQFTEREITRRAEFLDAATETTSEG
jgi:hypothetical protein